LLRTFPTGFKRDSHYRRRNGSHGNGGRWAPIRNPHPDNLGERPMRLQQLSTADIAADLYETAPCHSLDAMTVNQ
jgi:hypothetical protein